MRILALERPVHGASSTATPIHLRNEAAKVLEFYESGIIREIYFRADRREAVLLLECADATEATAILGTLPLVQLGLIFFDVIPLVPYSGFSRLSEPPPGELP